MEKERKIAAPEGCEIEKVELVDGVAVVTFREKELKLPVSWGEFCRTNPETKVGESCIMTDSSIRTLGFTSQRFVDKDKNLLPDLATAEAVLALCQLIQLRDCYNGDWMPDWSRANCNICYSDWNECFEVSVNVGITEILFFKSEELAEMFLSNFEDIIEKLKPLYGIKEEKYIKVDKKGGEE